MLAIYLRLSLADGDLGKDGKDVSNSIDNQRELIQSYIETKADLSAIPTKEYMDDGFTGTNFDRPGFQKMIEDIKSGLVNTIIVKDLSRFSRDYIAAGEYLEQLFPVLGVRFIAINNTFDSKNYKGTTMGLDIAVSNLINTMYSRDIGKKLRASDEIRWKKGYSTGGYALFGYTFDPENPNRYKIDPDAAKIVRRVFDLALLGLSTREIAIQMNEEKHLIPSAYAKKKAIPGKEKQRVLAKEMLWDSTKVWRILNFYEYTGAMVRGKHRVLISGSRKQRKQPRSKHIIVENCHEAIVTKEEWEKAREVIKCKGQTQFRTENKMPLQKKLRCGNCRRTLSKNMNVPSPFAWCDDGKIMTKFSNCLSEDVDIGDVENLVFKAIKDMLEVYLAAQGALDERDKERKSLLKEFEEYKKKTLGQIEGIKTDKVRLYESYADGKITREEYQIKKMLSDEKIVVLEEKIKAKEQEFYANKDDEEVIAKERDFRQMLSNAEKFLGATRLTYEMAQAFIDNVYVYNKKKIDICFKFQDELDKYKTVLKVSEIPVAANS